MPSFLSFIFRKRFPSRKTRRALFDKPLTLAHIAVYTFLTLSACLLYLLLIQINNNFLITVPAHGGVLTEGVIGAPRFINPLIANTQVDMGIAQLVYAGLTTTNKNGKTIPELAAKYDISPDGKTYTFTLHDGLVWSDKKPLTAKDVAFTVQKMQDPSINNLLASYWQTITIDVPDDSHIVFKLPNADMNFPAKASFGILPEHIWADVPSELFATDKHNLAPIGSGSFVVSHISYTNAIATKITLTANKHYILGKPFLKKLVISVYANQSTLLQALTKKSIDFTFALTPNNVSQAITTKNISAKSIQTNNEIALYRLSSEPMLANAAFATTLNQFLDRNKIIDTVENGYGTTSPTDTSSLTLSQAQAALATLGYTKTKDTLYKKGSLVGISIATENDPKMLAIARAVADQLNDLGLVTSVKAFDPGTFRTGVQKGEYSVILTTALAPLMSASYQKAFGLYTENVALVSNVRTGIPISYTLTIPALHYDNANIWYTETDRLWKWFIPKELTIK